MSVERLNYVVIGLYAANIGLHIHKFTYLPTVEDQLLSVVTANDTSIR